MLYLFNSIVSLLDSMHNLLVILIVVVAVILLLNLYMLLKMKKGAKSDILPSNQSPAVTGVDPATVAAITAAIGSILDEESKLNNNNSLGGSNAPQAKFIVKSIKKA